MIAWPLVRWSSADRAAVPNRSPGQTTTLAGILARVTDTVKDEKRCAVARYVLVG